MVVLLLINVLPLFVTSILARKEVLLAMEKGLLDMKQVPLDMRKGLLDVEWALWMGRRGSWTSTT